MDRNLLDKYFQDECTPEELEQVLRWLQTLEGRAFLEEDIDRYKWRDAHHSNHRSGPEIESEKVFKRIQLAKKNDRKRPWIWGRAASILLIVALLSAGLYGWGVLSVHTQQDSILTVTYQTASNQQKMITLADGTKVRLNEDSKLTVPKKSRGTVQRVTLKGEAYFEVIHNPQRTFVIEALDSEIKDLGTKFNVKTDSVAQKVEVAVTHGKVALQEKGKNSSAVLTKNHYGVLQFSNHQITIEEGSVQNYMSWINKRLVFKGNSLDKISRQLERLYNVKIRFKTNHLKKLNLTADFEKENLRSTLNIIARTLDIQFKIDGSQVVWMK